MDHKSRDIFQKFISFSSACVHACLWHTNVGLSKSKCCFFVGALWWLWWWWCWWRWIKFVVAFPPQCVDVDFRASESFRCWVLFLCYCGFLFEIIPPHLVTQLYNTITSWRLIRLTLWANKDKQHCDVICSINLAAIRFLLLFYTYVSDVFIRHLSSSKCLDSSSSSTN